MHNPYITWKLYSLDSYSVLIFAKFKTAQKYWQISKLSAIITSRPYINMVLSDLNCFLHVKASIKERIAVKVEFCLIESVSTYLNVDFTCWLFIFYVVRLSPRVWGYSRNGLMGLKEAPLSVYVPFTVIWYRWLENFQLILISKRAFHVNPIYLMSNLTSSIKRYRFSTVLFFFHVSFLIFSTALAL